MRYFYTCLYFLIGFMVMPAKAAKPNITAEDITKGANIIINSEEIIFTVTSVGSATTKVKTSVTILNDNGMHRAKLYVPYDKLEKVDYIKATSFDKSGKKIKVLKNSDITDVSAVSNFSVFEDNRVKVANMTYSIYPYTIEFEYQTTSRNMMFYPLWRPVDEEKLAVEKSTFQVLMPQGMPLRYREKNLPAQVKKETTASHDVYTWQIQKMAPVEREPFGPSFGELVPEVRTAPVAFEVEGYQGNMDSWKSYGQWINKLNSGRDVLPEATKQKLQAMVANAKTPEEKISKIYDHLQSNTRYVSIQLGIGGWQPFEASFVDTKGYGDCKALTNYTQAMLKAVGIDSYQALIRAGDDVTDIATNFPSSQFNHVILCVPTPQDTVWLECTSQVAAAGYTGSFTGDRHALLITPEGGKLVKTPDFKANDNVLKRSAVVKIDETGNATAKVTTIYSGLQQESRDEAIHNLQPDEQRKWLYQQVKVPVFDISNFSLSQEKKRLPQVTENLDLNVRKCATISGKRMFLSPNLMNKWTYTPHPIADRKTEVVREMAFLDEDVVEFELPTGYTLEYQPQEMSYASEFGKYTATVKVEGQKVKYSRTLQMDAGRYSPASYAKLIEFYNNVIKADNQQVVFVKNIP